MMAGVFWAIGAGWVAYLVLMGVMVARGQLKSAGWRP